MNEEKEVVEGRELVMEYKETIFDRIRWFVKRLLQRIKPEKGCMEEWAEKEVEIACKREAPDRKKGEWDYGCSCYESALKAYKSLCKEGHSGCSIGFTKNILIRLIEGKPLTPITEDDFLEEPRIAEDPEYLKERGLKSSKQCVRMSSLFRNEYLDGMTVEYIDIGRVACRNRRTGSTYYNGKGNEFVRKLFPITLPYMPKQKPYIVVTDDCLIDRKIGDWDTEAWYEIITPEGEHIPLNKFYKYEGSDENEIEITEEEFNQRKEMDVRK